MLKRPIKVTNNICFGWEIRKNNIFNYMRFSDCHSLWRSHRHDQSFDIVELTTLNTLLLNKANRGQRNETVTDTDPSEAQWAIVQPERW